MHPQDVDSSTTMRELWGMFLRSRHFNDLSPLTRDSYEQVVRSSMQERRLWWDMPLAGSLKRSEWTRTVRVCVDNHGHAQARKLQGCVRAALSPVEDRIDGLTLPSVPIRARRRSRKEVEAARRLLTREEMSDLATKLAALAPKDTVACGLLLNLYLGLRAGELLSLEWEMIDLDAPSVAAFSDKTGVMYPTKHLPDWLAEHMRAWKERSLSMRLYTMNRRHFHRRVRRLLDAAGYPWVTNHTIRRSVGTQVFDMHGARAAAAWLAHKSVRTTLEHYVRTSGAAPRKVIDLPAPIGCKGAGA